MKGRKSREAGGVNEAAEDLKNNPEMRVNAPKIKAAAEERKSGGRTARKHGGEVHKTGCKCEKCMGGKVAKQDGGKVDGDASAARADRKPRKSGGSATSNPFSSAHHGTPAPGRKVDADTMD